MNRYALNIIRLCVQLLPIDWRRIKTINLFRSLLYPIQRVHLAFYENASNNEIKIAHNSQVCSLKKRLNDLFDIDQRRITILDGDFQQQNYIYIASENQPQFLNTFYTYQTIEHLGVYDFIVSVPTDVQDPDNIISKVIKQYKLAGKTFKIKRV